MRARAVCSCAIAASLIAVHVPLTTAHERRSSPTMGTKIMNTNYDDEGWLKIACGYALAVPLMAISIPVVGLPALLFGPSLCHAVVAYLAKKEPKS